jgi:serine/threonine protein kinase
MNNKHSTTLSGIVSGQKLRWSLLDKIGEGDAGEVYLVESLLEKKPAILKRPRKSTFTSDILRQASQINSEGKILKSLQGILKAYPGTCLRTPALLDESLSGADYGEQQFIVIAPALGIDLKTLARTAIFGTAGDLTLEPSLGFQKIFIRRIADQMQVPDLIILYALSGIIELFEIIHFADFNQDATRYFGILWNDVKPEHIYWDPFQKNLTFIDWGNGQFLDSNGNTKDGFHSRINDYHQFIAEFGTFLSETSPKLYERLNWPAEISPGNAYTEGVKPLKNKILSLINEAEINLGEARRIESDLIQITRPNREDLVKLEKIHQRILDYGHVPDYPGAIRIYTNRARRVVAEKEIVSLKNICGVATNLPNVSTDKWNLLSILSDIALDEVNAKDVLALENFSLAFEAGLNENWPALLWELLKATGNESIPNWWEDISSKIRHLFLHTDENAVTPYIVISRLYFTLQAAQIKSGDQRHPVDSSAGIGSDEASKHWQAFEQSIKILQEEVMRKWKELEPAPPNSGIEYLDIENITETLEGLLPGTRQSLERALSQPKAQASIVMEAWRQRDFETARHGLRILLCWDPHRRRVLKADDALLQAPRWLSRLRSGIKAGDSFEDFLIEMELTGRDLRNQVGPARWLDLILDSLKKLRNRARPADLIMEHPELINDIPWINEYRSRETLSLPRKKDLVLERTPIEETVPTFSIRGMREAKIGPGQPVEFGEALDTWLPEARGSSARVFAGNLRDANGTVIQCAIKLMRPDRIEYALPLFREEVQILNNLQDVSGVTPMLECGYVKLNNGKDLPAEEKREPASGLDGEIQRFGIEETQNFLAVLDARIGQGWIPYLALEKRAQGDNLMAYCDAGFTHGRFLPLIESLILAIQICDILQSAHERNIVYRDHKILHYYWDKLSQGVTVIDWNIAKHYPQGLADTDKQFDLVQFGARALHHILTGRTAPGALPLGPNRPEDIERASHSYIVQWTYDDERLPNRIKEILEKVLSEGYASIRDLRQDLYQVYEQIALGTDGASRGPLAEGQRRM